MYPNLQQTAATSNNTSTSGRGTYFPSSGHRASETQFVPPGMSSPSASDSQASPFPLLRVSIAEQYRTQPPVMIGPGLQEAPRSQPAFDFQYEHEILAKTSTSVSSHPVTGQSALAQAARRGDSYADSCTQMERKGYSQEEVVMALVVLGSAEADSRVTIMCDSYRQLRAMGFQPATIVGALKLHGGELQAATDACLTCAC